MKKAIIKNTKIFLMLLTLGTFIACGIDEIVPSECSKNLNELYRGLNNDYNDYMTHVKDSSGNGQSLEACLLRKERTIDHINNLESWYYAISEAGTADGCTQEEINAITKKMSDRMDDLYMDMESTWNRCEEVYGGG